MTRALVGLLGCLFVTTGATAHDMYLKVPDHQVPAGQEIEVTLINGTFQESENSIDRNRMLDVSVVAADGRVTHPAPGQWRDQDNASILTFKTGEPGTLVVGVSTKARIIELSADDFNDYLLHDGVLDVHQARKESGSLDQPARERYSKHVKTLLQVDGSNTDSWKTRLGYPIEIVPLEDPGTLKVGEDLNVLVLLDGEPVANQLVYASHEGFHGHAEDGSHQEAIKTRTNDEGVAKLELTHAGRWFARLIHMVPSQEDDVDYVSTWATLTFQVR